MQDILIENISKTYRQGFGANRGLRALDNLTLAVQRGEIFSLIGPNGAGKTTLVRILLGFLRKDSGTAFILGQNITGPNGRKSVGYLPENVFCPPHLTPIEFLTAWGCFGGSSLGHARRQAGDLLERLGLAERSASRIGEFSKGMMLRLGLAQALTGDPQVLILDEPTDGLDATSRIHFREVLQELRGREKTILMNSHLLSEVERISDRVGILVLGKLRLLNNVGNIAQRLEEYCVTFESESSAVVDGLRATYEVAQMQSGWVVNVHTTTELERLLGYLRERNANVRAVDQKKISLEDVFVQISKGSA